LRLRRHSVNIEESTLTESTRLLTSAQAAARLGVKPATLYAYVSRGLIERRTAPDGRTSLYDAADLARLERRSAKRHGSPADVVVASELTFVDTEAARISYRGLDPIDASRTRRFEEIAGWLWNGNFDGTGVWRSRRLPALPAAMPMLDRLQLTAAQLATSTQPSSTIGAATQLMSCLVDALPGASSGGSFAERLWTKLGASRGDPKVLDVALSLTADHGLTYSSLIARVAAAGGADVASCVTAAMSAGRASVASSRFREIETALANGTTIEPDTSPYPHGDPRGAAMLALLEVGEAATVRSLAGDAPSAVVAQAAIAWASGMKPGSSEVISLISRVAGWIAHALEEYRRPTPFRPRLAYTGPAPRSTPIRMLDAVQGYLARE
jgi:citrate synthase